MRKKWMIVVTAALFTVSVICGCANPHKMGVDALEKGNYEEAEAQFKELIEADGEKSAEGYRGLGMVYYETGEYKAALEAFQQAEEAGIQPSVQMYNLMAVCAMQTEQYAPALEYIRAGLSLADTEEEDKQSSEELIQEMKFNEIICCERQADWEGAKQKMAEYLEKYPDDENAQREAEFLATR